VHSYLLPPVFNTVLQLPCAGSLTLVTHEVMKHFLLLFLLTLAGCVGTRSTIAPRIAEGYCAPPVAYRYDAGLIPLPSLEAALTPELLNRYPRRNLLTANAVGIIPMLQELVVLEAKSKQAPNNQTSTAILQLRQRILTQVVLVGTTIASVAAELDCEGERAEQVAGYLSNRDNQRTQRLNVLSIAVGAASGIGTTLFEKKAAQYTLGIGGGVLAAGLGLLTLTGSHTAEFTHPRNLLAEVWTGAPTASTFPPSLWCMLTEPAFSNSGQTSIAYNTRQRWQHYSQLADPDSKASQQLVRLLFGAGGRYSAEQLTVRANMLNELQSAVHLLNQELQGLLLVLSETPR